MRFDGKLFLFGLPLVAIAAIALTVWVLAETISRRDWLGLVAIPATFLIGVSFGLPLYLFLRSRPSVG